MVDVAVTVEDRLRVAGDDHVRLKAADEFGDFLAQGNGRFQFTIRLAQEDGLFDTEDGICGALFLLADRGQSRLIIGIMLDMALLGIYSFSFIGSSLKKQELCSCREEASYFWRLSRTA